MVRVSLFTRQLPVCCLCHCATPNQSVSRSNNLSSIFTSDCTHDADIETLCKQVHCAVQAGKHCLHVNRIIPTPSKSSIQSTRTVEGHVAEYLTPKALRRRDLVEPMKLSRLERQPASIPLASSSMMISLMYSPSGPNSSSSALPPEHHE